jgi:1-aminocyclopropane-1-carboxylate deaminase
MSLDELQRSIASPKLQKLQSPLLESKQLQLSILRLDSMHPTIQGNKWFKLRLNLAHAVNRGYSKVISFGGAYSNHLYALAAAGSALGLETLGVVRGELVEPFNPVISFVKRNNMALVPVTRAEYRRKHEANFLAQLLEQFGPAYVIPEGGSNKLGVEGCEDIASLIASVSSLDNNTVTALACGTGATMAGVVDGFVKLDVSNRVLGVSVLKAPGLLAKSVAQQIRRPGSAAVPWSVSDDYHFGGYGKANPQLVKFIAESREQHSLPLEHVYTGKLLFALDSMIRQNKFPPGTHICALHTGGVI